MSEYIYGETNSSPSEPIRDSSESAAPETAEQTEHVYMDSPVPPTPEAPKPPRKKRKFPLTALTAAICLVCVLGCGAAGYFGAAYAISHNDHSSGGTSGGITQPQSGGTTVVYRTVSTVLDSTGTTNTVSSVAASVANSVVEITTEETVSSSFYQYIQSGAGSGVIVSEDGYILTCNHVIESSSGNGYVSSVKVTLHDGTEYPATIVGADSDTDIAVIKVEASGLSAAVLGSSASLTVGEGAVAVGNPLGQLGGTVTDGIVSALDREITINNETMTLLQTNAAVSPGNSGGGLFNMKGELIGIVNAKYSESGIEGLGFAIPVDKAWSVAEQLLQYGFVRGKVVVGISMRNVTDAASAYYYYGRRNAGVYIDTVTEGYNDKLLQRGDRILAVNGEEISSYTEIKTIIQNSQVGDVLQFTLSRASGASSEVVTVDVVCYEYIPEGANVNFDN